MTMKRYILTSLVCGLLFGLLDALVNANPLARDLYAVYAPIARETVNMPAGILIDLAYGFLLTAIFLLLYPSLPGRNNLVKGLSYGVLAWFFRVEMAAASQWMMFEIPWPTLTYMVLAGLLEMALLGLVMGALAKARRTGG